MKYQRIYTLRQKQAINSFEKLKQQITTKHNTKIYQDPTYMIGKALTNIETKEIIIATQGIYCDNPRKINANEYTEMIATLLHETEHIIQKEKNTPEFKQIHFVNKNNPKLYMENYTNNPLELQAERNAMQKLHPWLCQNFGEKTGETLFYTRIHDRMYGPYDYFIHLPKDQITPENITKAFDQKIQHALKQPIWYSDRIESPKYQNDLIPRLAAKPEYKPLDKHMRQQTNLHTSYRKLTALCQKADPTNIPQNIKDLQLSMETEFPQSLLQEIKRKTYNEYEKLQEDCKPENTRHPMTNCRIIIQKAIPTKNPDITMVCLRQACDLTGRNCPITAHSYLTNRQYQKSDGTKAVTSFHAYPTKTYQNMLDSANKDGDAPVFYANFTESADHNFSILPDTILPSHVPFSRQKHNENQQKLRSKTKLMPAETTEKKTMQQNRECQP